MKREVVLPEAIRRIRVKRQMQQKELAAAVGVLPAHICRIESGAEQPSDFLADRIAAVLGCKLTDFTAPKPARNTPQQRRPRPSKEPAVQACSCNTAPAEAISA